MDTLKRWQSMTYIGIGRKSNPNSYDPFLKQAILVVNQEFYYHPNKHFKYSLALSYRRQDEYADSAPYQHEADYFKQEFRLYGRASYILPIRFVKLALTAREEFRKFYTPKFKNHGENFELRTRFKVQLSINLNKSKTQKLSVSSEQLFAISEEAEHKKWSGFDYRESRLTLYYSLSPHKLPLSFDIGYMGEVVGNNHPYVVHHIAVDVIMHNLFHPGHAHHAQHG
ncbi:MAG: DUF2490 domain-containing protein [Bacteroidetes bacterium]|nr:DUF2490 domain-containing protein [Bacteroidota bacterium]